MWSLFLPPEEFGGLLSAKGGLMMGTKKGGCSPQPAKGNLFYYNITSFIVKKMIQKIFLFIVLKLNKLWEFSYFFKKKIFWKIENFENMFLIIYGRN